MQAGLVLAARLRVRGAERQVDRAPELLVEQDVAREDVDRVVFDRPIGGQGTCLTGAGDDLVTLRLVRRDPVSAS